MKSNELLRHLVRKLDTPSDRELVQLLGIPHHALNHWRRETTILAPLQVANALARAHATAKRLVHETAVKPVVEFFPIKATDVGKKKKRFEVFPTGENVGQHQHLAGLHGVLLNARSGIYIFYDTRGRALYAGQTKKQNLWKEMNLAFNRDRSAQVITLVNHPTNDVAFRSAHQKVRQPVDRTLKLFDLARYFSAFEVVPEMVDDFEALLVRAFPNDLLNFKMERFGKPARKRAAKKNSHGGRKRAT